MRRKKRKEEGTPYDSTDEEDGDGEPEKKGCSYYFNEIDKRLLKPILVYKYN